ncbi:MAG TPA: hypothetical protein DD670_21545 [Planctomycetaceae bacterium]|nr:hypothetical protein [Planctomycetaceae bacterium]
MVAFDLRRFGSMQVIADKLFMRRIVFCKYRSFFWGLLQKPWLLGGAGGDLELGIGQTLVAWWAGRMFREKGKGK